MNSVWDLKEKPKKKVIQLTLRIVGTNDINKI
jgi:hypothetical protein